MIKYLVMDVDGTLTDGNIYMGANGEIMKAFNIKDGYGIHDILIPNNIKPIIITGRNSSIVINRAKELGIEEIHQNCSDKLLKLSEIVDDLSAVAYIGDDLNDMCCVTAIKQAGGFVGCPADAVKEIKNISDFVSSFNGGNGAVREFIEWIIVNNQHLNLSL